MLFAIHEVVVHGRLGTAAGNTSRAAQKALAEVLGPFLPYLDIAHWREQPDGTHRLAEISLAIGNTQITMVNTEISSWREAMGLSALLDVPKYTSGEAPAIGEGDGWRGRQ